MKRVVSARDAEGDGASYLDPWDSRAELVARFKKELFSELVGSAESRVLCLSELLPGGTALIRVLARRSSELLENPAVSIRRPSLRRRFTFFERQSLWWGRYTPGIRTLWQKRWWSLFVPPR